MNYLLRLQIIAQCPVLSLPTRLINPADCMASMSRFMVFSDPQHCSKIRDIYWDKLVFYFVSYTCSQLHFMVERRESDTASSLYQEFLRQQLLESVAIDIADALKLSHFH